MKHVIIILNYNDFETTNTLVSKIKNYQVFDKILIVDNASTDSSVDFLKQLKSDKVDLIVAPRNEGYAKGNNFGISHAIHKFQPEFITIANPDIFVEESVIYKIEKTLKEDESFAMGASLVYKGYNAWKLPTYFGVLQSLFPFQRFIKKYLARRKLKKSRNEYEIVDVIEGSMFCVKAKAMEAVGGFDDKTFLYVEEVLLAARMRSQGYRSILLPQEVYYHYHSVSVRKQYKNKAQIFRFIQEGYRIYCQDYLRVNEVQKFFFDRMADLAYLERTIFDSIMKLKNFFIDRK